MSSSVQTFVALAIVVVTLALMVRSALKKRAKPGCGCGDNCGAVTPEVKKLQNQLKRAGH